LFALKTFLMPRAPPGGGWGVEPDVDIMGVKRGKHKDGEDICKHYKFHKPGGPGLWGWNDAKGAYCDRCGCRDLDHIILRDMQLEEPKPRQQQRRLKPPNPSPFGARTASTLAATMDDTKQLQENQALGLLDEMSDPFAIAAGMTKALPPAVAPLVTPPATLPTSAAPAAVAPTPMVDLEKVSKALSIPTESNATSIQDFLATLSLERYREAFENEELEIPVLISLARGEGKEALDEALKEVGVKSVGHRLKIFSALQAM